MFLPNPLTSQGRAKYGIAAVGLSILALSSPVATAGTVDPNYKIGSWRGFRNGAITYTFDDGTANQFAVAVPMFNAAGYRMTLFTITKGNFGFAGWQRLKDAAAAGHEIASHTETHTRLTTLSVDLQVTELKGSRDSIIENVPGKQGLTVAYPECAIGDRPTAQQYYIAGRACSSRHAKTTPDDFYRIPAWSVGSEGPVYTTADFIAKANEAANANAWAVYLIHAINTDQGTERGWSPVHSSVLQESLNYFKENDNRFWVDSFVNVILYIRERNDASVAEISKDDNSIVVRVTDTLDNAIYDHPISIRRALPAGWLSAKVTQAAQEVPHKIVDVSGVQTIEFDAVPDAGDVVITRLGPPPPALDLSWSETANGVTLELTGEAGRSYILYSSDDLNEWTTIQTITLEGTKTSISIEDTTGSRFYRAETIEEEQ